MIENVNIWDKLNDETSKAFHAFSIYIALGANRSHNSVAKKIEHKNTKTIEIWSKKFNWVKRAEAYDLDFMLKSQTENRLRVNNIHKLLLRLFELPAMVLAKKLSDDPKLLWDMPVKELFKLIYEGAKHTPSIATAQEINISQFVDDMKSDSPDDEFAKILENLNINETLNDALDKLQTLG